MTFRKTVTLEEFEKLVSGAGKKAPKALTVAMRAAVQSMVRDVTLNRLTNQYLRVRTGTARRSIVGDVKATPGVIVGRIGSPLRYVRAHEIGFQGAVNVRAHTRRLSQLETRRGKATKRSVRDIKRRLRRGRAGYAHVRAHKRVMNLRARRFLRDTVLQEAGALPTLLASGQPPITARVTRALRILILTGRVPRVAHLGVG